MEDDKTHKTLAAARWKILRRAILAARHKESSEGAACQRNSASVRRFSSFNLFRLTELARPSSPLVDRLQIKNEQFDSGRWFQYTYCMPNCGAMAPESRQTWSSNVLIKHLSEPTSLEAMMGFNNTGNVCVWPSEEVLAHYCLAHAEKFHGKTVCELGCGMAGLAGVMLAQTQLPAAVVLTDGNETSIENIKDILDANVSRFGSVSVSCEVLVWDQAFIEEASKLDSKFDCVICADCLFFEDLHSVLVKVIHKLLKPSGTVLIFAPQRAGSFDRFAAVASEAFTVQRQMQYDQTVWEKHKEALSLSNSSGTYSPDLHFPLMLTLTW